MFVPSNPADRRLRRGRSAPRFALGAPLFLTTLAVLAALAAAGRSQAQTIATPFTQNDVALTNLATEITYKVDFSTLPLRPKLIVEAAPDVVHPDMELRLEITNCNFFYPNPGVNCEQTFTPGHLPRVSTPKIGSQSVDFQPAPCGAIEEFTPPYVGKTCDVKVRALGFGSAGAPATFNITIRGETVVPTATLSPEVTTKNIQTVSIAPTKDTTLYQANPGSSNGQGDSFWTSLGTGANALHSLLAFNVQAIVPAGVTISDARLELNVISASSSPGLAVYAVPRNPSVTWAEGNADAAGDESSPPTPLGNAATWSHRQWFSSGALGAWSTAGGDRSLPALLSASVTQTGALVLSSPALLNHIRAIHANTTTHDGLLLVPTSGAARFASDENLTLSARPRLVIQYFNQTIANNNNENLPVGTVFYFNEGQSFRWIYDLDNDNVLITPVAGRCQFTPPPPTFNQTVAYSYQYQGNPTYQGLDCCTWQLGSRTGVTGTGQAIFYINTDPTIPANQPGDLDLDGIKDLCDNCPTRPNGPFLGSCTAGPRTGNTCRSNQQCNNFPCSLAQDDDDRATPVGNACVPEPGISSMLGGGMLALIALERRRRALSPRLTASC